MSRPDPGPLAKGTLGRRLVLRVVAILTVLALAIGALSLIAVNQVLTRQLDSQLSLVQAREPRQGPGHNDDDLPPGTGEFGNPIGTIKVQSRNSNIRATLLGESGLSAPSAHAIARLLALPTDGQARTVFLDDLGQYRVRATQRGSEVQVVALPLTSVTSVLSWMALLEGALLLAAIAAAVLITRTVVVNSLRPLNRVAATAREVSQLELTKGEVDLPVRVAAGDADPSTEVGRVGQALNHLIDNVESALAARQRTETKVRQFVADASHELRNPLASIRGYSELTRRGRETLPDQAAFAMGRIEAESARMSRLVDDLLLLARLDSDQGIDLAETDLVEIVLNTVSDARAAGPDHHWKLDLPHQQVLVRADAHRLTQVMVNLLSNARKHTLAGTSVTTRVSLDPGRAQVSVTDDGPGIEPTVVATVFERFARADVARSHADEPSTGLGLAIVQAVMAAHDGDVTVESNPGRTTFTITLPLAAEGL